VEELSVEVATDERPHAPVARVRDKLATTDRARGFVPVVHPVYLRAVLDHLEMLSVDLVVAPTAAETLERDHTDALERLRSDGDVALLSTDAVPAYGVALLDGDAYLGVYDDGMRPVAVVHARSDHPIAEWARERYESVRADANPL